MKNEKCSIYKICYAYVYRIRLYKIIKTSEFNNKKRCNICIRMF